MNPKLNDMVDDSWFMTMANVGNSNDKEASGNINFLFNDALTLQLTNDAATFDLVAG